MTEPTKIDFRYRRMSRLDDLTDLVATLFPGNRNQQHAAARILLLLKSETSPVSSLCSLEERDAISRRTLQRTRAKLARLGMIERVSWMNSRYGGKEGWRLSSRMSSGLRQLADRLESWLHDKRSDRLAKDEQLVTLIR